MAAKRDARMILRSACLADSSARKLSAAWSATKVHFSIAVAALLAADASDPMNAHTCAIAAHMM